MVEPREASRRSEGRHRPAAPSGGRLQPLDGLRAVAVAVVFVHHADVARWPGGFLGVDVFFAISGYIITTQLMREWKRKGDFWLKGFYARRGLRLMPALVAVVVVMVPVSYVLKVHSTISGAAAVTYLMDIYAPIIGTSGGIFGHTWSLAVEEQFYLIWPAVLLFMLRRGRVRAASAAITAAAAVCLLISAAVAVAKPAHLTDVYRTPLPHLVVIAAGVLLALAFAQPNGQDRFRRLAHPGVPLAALLALLVAALKLKESAHWMYEGGFVLVAIGGAALVAHVVLAPESIVSRFLSLKPVLWLGTRSYGFYLWHYPVLVLSAKHITNLYAHLLFGLIVTLIVTELSWRIVEQPFLRYKERRFA